MADARESRLRHGLDALKRLGVPAEAATVEALANALEAGPETALAVADLCGGIASEASAALLRRIEDGARQDKLLRREARRALYRLKQKGVVAAEPARAAEAEARPALSGPEAEGFLSAGDPLGDRLFWILKPRSGGGLFHLSTVVNEPGGLKEAVLAEVNRKGMRALREELQSRHGLRMVEVDWRYCDAIASEGYERARSRGQVAESAAHYPQLRLQLFAAGAKPIIKAMTDIQSQVTSNPTSITQWAAVEALAGPQDEIAKMVGEFDRRRRVIVGALNAMPGIRCVTPRGAFYVFPNVSGLFGKRWKGGVLKGSADVCAFLLDEARIATVAGVDFGSDAHIRLSYATGLETIKDGMSRMAAALRKLDG